MLAKKLRMLAVYSASSALRDSLDMGVLPVGFGRLLVMPWVFRRLVVDEGSTMVVLMLFCYASLSIFAQLSRIWCSGCVRL